MADVNFFDAFTYKWALVGPTEILQDDQYKQGWGFIGSVPPSVEQFNRVHQVADEKANYLYAQMSAVFSVTGQVPSAVSLTTLRDALRGTGLFQTAVTGTADTSAATTEFVRNSISASSGRLITVRTFATSTTFVPSPGARLTIIEGVGGGGGGGGVGAAGAGAAVAAGGGSAGAYVRALVIGPLTNQAVTIGAAGSAGVGAANGGSGGSSVFGGYVTLPGGGGGASGLGSAVPVVSGTPGAVSAAPTVGGGAIWLAGFNGEQASAGLVLSSSCAISGAGGSGPLGAGGGVTGGNSPVASVGKPGTGYGAGGGGGLGIANGATNNGSAGQPGIFIVTEFS